MDRLPVFDTEEDTSLDIKTDVELGEVIPEIPPQEDTDTMFIKPEPQEVEQKLDGTEVEVEMEQKSKPVKGRGRPKGTTTVPEVIDCPCGAKIRKKGYFLHKRSKKHKEYLISCGQAEPEPELSEDDGAGFLPRPKQEPSLDYDKFHSYMEKYEDHKESKRQRLQREKEEEEKRIQAKIEEEKQRERFYYEKFQKEQEKKKVETKKVKQILNQPQPTFGKYSNYF